MAVQKIAIYGTNEVLRAKCREIDFDRDADLLKVVAQDLADSLLQVGGAGLAAPQIGIPVRIIALNPALFGTNLVMDSILINPEIVEMRDGFALESEGCLSLPGVREVVGRFRYCKVKYQNVHGQKRHVIASSLTGRLLSRCLQHEIDHINGKLIVDYVSKGRQKLAAKKMRAIGRKAA
jgi:peptide deformylase